jgi:hypothetical protein
MSRDDPQIRPPLDDDDIAALEQRGAEMERTGESIFRELNAQCEINKLTVKLDCWRKATAATEAKNPTDERLERAREIMAGLEAELFGWRRVFLKSWRPDRTKPN